MSRALTLVGLAVVAGCAQPPNAILEVRMRLPAVERTGGPMARPFAHVAVLTAGDTLVPGEPYTGPSEPFDLRRSGCNVTLSIVADDPRKDRARLERAADGGDPYGLALFVWFCPGQAPCSSAESPTWLLGFDRALWPGERSVFEADVPGGDCSAWESTASELPAVQGGASENLAFSREIGVCDVLACRDPASTPAENVGFCDLNREHPCD